MFKTTYFLTVCILKFRLSYIPAISIIQLAIIRQPDKYFLLAIFIHLRSSASKYGQRQPASSLNEARKTLGVMTCVEPIKTSQSFLAAVTS